MTPDVIHFHLKLLTDVYSLVLLLPLHSQGLQPSPPQPGKNIGFSILLQHHHSLSSIDPSNKGPPPQKKGRHWVPTNPQILILTNYNQVDVYIYFFEYEINAVNLTSTKPPTPSREAVPTPKPTPKRQQSPTNGGRRGNERKKNCSHVREDLIIN